MSSKYSIDPISKFKSHYINFKYLSKLLAVTFLQKSKKIVRTQTVSYDEYNLNWKKIHEKNHWTEYNNLYDFCFPKFRNNEDFTKTIVVRLVENNLCHISLYDYWKFKHSVIEKLFKSYIQDEPIVELGTGSGLHLFILKALRFENNLEGYEYTENGIVLSKKINEYFKSNIAFGRIDLTKNFKLINLKNKTIFTHYVMEQLKYDTANVIENILESKPKQVLHIEPCYELFGNNFRDSRSK